ncbi:MAG: hypothetical protein M3077_14445 [Candidatus Dormibacteraeota bacterium]|nr:hypothetical protein [Candidatus Dormibacteraeota bacterium]
MPVVIGYAVPAPGANVELRAPATDTERRGIARAAAFRQRSSNGDIVIVYRETDGATAAQPPVTVEMLIRQRPSQRGSLYLMALPVFAGKAARLHEFSMELNGIHFTEFQESLGRFGVGITVFLQHEAEGDLLVFAVEGDAPATWLQRLGTSADPFDRWFAQELRDQSGAMISSTPRGENEQLWSMDGAAALASET